MKYDLENTKSALTVSERVYEAVRTCLRPGITERQVYDTIERTVAANCAGHAFEFIGDFVSGPRSGGVEGPATDRVIQAGDNFLLDLSVRFDGGWCDTCRTFFIGEPGEEKRRAYEAVLSCMGAGESAIRVGVGAREIKAVMERRLASLGFAGLMPHHGGHAVGKTPFAPPVFVTESEDVLGENEVVTLEPGLYFEGQWGIRVENDYIVLRDGVEKLFNYPTAMDYFIISAEGETES